MKTTDKLGWILAICSALFMGGFIRSEYKNAVYVEEHGYSKETTARMDDLIAGLTPLSVADLGMEAK